MPIRKFERSRRIHTPDRNPVAERKIALATELNDQLRAGTGIAELSHLLRQVERPILVDFNNVLANNSFPLVPNIDAKDAFEELKKIGTVVIVTSGGPVSAIRGALVKFGFWSDDVIIIALENYRKYFRDEYDDPAFLRLIDEFEDLAREHNLFDFPVENDGNNHSVWRTVEGYKR